MVDMTSSTPIKKICVFCGSSFGSNELYAEVAADLGARLASLNWGLVYGGGSTGLMGKVARGCATNGGYVHGIIPDALVCKERTVPPNNNMTIDEHKGHTPLPDSKEYGKTTIVKDMHTRKRLMGQEADAFVALPGGYGTIEELMEVVTWCQLNIHNKPIVVFNINGFYDNFLKFIDDAIQNEFVSKSNRDIIKVANTVDEVFHEIENYEIPQGRFNLEWNST
jgi:uncharacterized protein (TIGR00730 family)